MCWTELSYFDGVRGSFPFSRPFFVPRLGTAIVEKIVKKTFLLLGHLELRSHSEPNMSVYFPVILAASL